MMESEQPLNIMPRACPNCRLRKVRCDRSTPCSSCVASGLTCRSSTKSAAEPIPVAVVYEQHFERLHQRLAAIEEAIEKSSRHEPISQCVQQPQSQKQSQKQLHETVKAGSHFVHINDDDDVRFSEGESSFGRQTMVATQMHELRDTSCAHSTTIAEELKNLKRLLNEDHTFLTKGDLYFPTSSPDAPKPRDKSLLPTEFVLRLLRTVDNTKPVLFTLYGLDDCAQIQEICAKVYFPIQPTTAVDLALCHGILYTLLHDQDILAHHELKPDEATSYRQMSKDIFQAGVESYDIMAIPAFKHALVLTLAMSHAQNEAKLPLQWTLTSVAARHCLALGYHREDRLIQLPPWKAQRARRLFWHIYTSDKNLSSRLGRSSVIQDYDLDTKFSAISSDPGRAPWDQATIAFVELSQLQGRIYEALYSASANMLDSSARSQIISSLADKLVQWYNGWVQIDSSCAHQRERFNSIFEPVDIVYYSVLTLLHRGASSQSMLDISAACLEAAYQCLNAHLAYLSRNQPLLPYILPGYTIWIFNYTSFTAFIVVFTNCVVNKSSSDLKLLHKALLPLEQAAIHFDYSKWQLDVCNILYRIADAFNQLRQEERDEISTSLPNTFMDGWSWLDTNLSPILDINSQLNY
ncbi:hypothetical protein FOYG_17088 [Fusarium oxysporum NRRL 32931]|uniref:Zn(2)-C6 fungal-type domain-containing protein n=1 Tax=Fusarium oxysporum NRRL 32931 TaxID=660029 RepID=W9HFL4_FUSOX|nr:hypothetical protein FOYG_17088 [Fusarium oxysporum NRRL 32931]